MTLSPLAKVRKRRMPHSVTVALPISDGLAKPMADMRRWLDQRKSNPNIFRYTYEHSRILFHVSFNTEAEADQFAKTFTAEIAA